MRRVIGLPAILLLMVVAVACGPPVLWTPPDTEGDPQVLAARSQPAAASTAEPADAIAPLATATEEPYPSPVAPMATGVVARPGGAASAYPEAAFTVDPSLQSGYVLGATRTPETPVPLSRSPAVVPDGWWLPTATPLTSPASPLSPPIAPLPTALPSPTSPPTATPDPFAVAGVPVRLELPSIAVEALVEQVGLTEDRSMDVPRGWMNVGWFMHGFRPGEPGNAVIAGHLDTNTGGPAVFWDLNRLRPGDEAIVTYENGDRYTFIVQGAELYDADADGPIIERIFGPSQTADLNLITCDGAWDHGRATYTKRLVVFTTLAPEKTVHAARVDVYD